MKWLKLLKRAVELNFSKEFAYKGNSFIKAFAIMFSDIVGPLVVLLIYTASSGIPGWTFHEFLLFQGTLLIAFGIGHTFFIIFPWWLIDLIKEGEFDKILVKPYNPLAYLLLLSFVAEGLPEILTGALIAGFAWTNLSIPVLSVNTLTYLLLLAVAALFQCTAMILIGSLAFLVVRSDALMQLFFKLSDFARYPFTVYTASITFIFTFLFPIGVSSFYPAEALLRGLNLGALAQVTLPVFALFALSIFLWGKAMKKYTSAGG